MLFKKILLALSLLLCTGLPLVAAQAAVTLDKSLTTVSSPNGRLGCPAGLAGCDDTAKVTDAASGTTAFVLRIVGGFLNLAAIAAVILIVIAGLRLVIAGGNDEDVKAAHKNILWTLLGLLVVILSLFLVKNISKTLYEVTQPTFEDAEIEDTQAQAGSASTVDKQKSATQMNNIEAVKGIQLVPSGVEPSKPTQNMITPGSQTRSVPKGKTNTDSIIKQASGAIK